MLRNRKMSLMAQSVKSRNANYSGRENKKKMKMKKRRHKKPVEKYEKIVKVLELGCCSYKDVLKNPFRRLNGDENKQQLLDKLGNSDKILGILQCYDYFAPLSKSCVHSIEYSKGVFGFQPEEKIIFFSRNRAQKSREQEK